MLQILENAPNRLILRMGTLPFETSTIILDKSSGKGRFERTTFFWKRQPVEVPLEQIAAITLIPREKDANQKGAKRDNPTVGLTSGQQNPAVQSRRSEICNRGGATDEHVSWAGGARNRRQTGGRSGRSDRHRTGRPAQHRTDRRSAEHGSGSRRRGRPVGAARHRSGRPTGIAKRRSGRRAEPRARDAADRSGERRFADTSAGRCGDGTAAAPAEDGPAAGRARTAFAHDSLDGARRIDFSAPWLFSASVQRGPPTGSRCRNAETRPRAICSSAVSTARRSRSNG